MPGWVGFGGWCAIAQEDVRFCLVSVPEHFGGQSFVLDLAPVPLVNCFKWRRCPSTECSDKKSGAKCVAGCTNNTQIKDEKVKCTKSSLQLKEDPVVVVVHSIRMVLTLWSELRPAPKFISFVAVSFFLGLRQYNVCVDSNTYLNKAEVLHKLFCFSF